MVSHRRAWRHDNGRGTSLPRPLASLVAREADSKLAACQELLALPVGPTRPEYRIRGPRNWLYLAGIRSISMAAVTGNLQIPALDGETGRYSWYTAIRTLNAGRRN